MLCPVVNLDVDKALAFYFLLAPIHDYLSISMPALCLRAGLPLMLWCLSLVLWKCATPVVVRVVGSLCVVLSACGPSLRAG